MVNMPKSKDMRYIPILWLLLAGAGGLRAQLRLTEQEAVELALRHHPAMAVADLAVRRQEVLRKAPTPWSPAQVFHNVAADPDLGLFGTSSLGVQQSFPSLRSARAVRDLHGRLREQALAQQAMTAQEITRQVREIFHHLSYLEGKLVLYQQLDSLYRRLGAGAETRYQAGDISAAEKLAIADKSTRMGLNVRTIRHEIEFDRVVLQQLLGSEEPVEPIVRPLYEGGFALADSTLLRTAARARYSEAAVAVARSQSDLVAAEFAPTFSVGVFGQYLANGAVYPGWQLGMNLPLVRKPLSAQLEAARTDLAQSQAAYRQVLLEQQTAWGHLLHEQEKYQLMLDYYAREGKQLAAALLREGEANFLGGEISFSDFILLQEQAADIETGHLEDLLGLNQTIIAMEALTGQ